MTSAPRAMHSFLKSITLLSPHKKCNNNGSGFDQFTNNVANNISCSQITISWQLILIMMITDVYSNNKIVLQQGGKRITNIHVCVQFIVLTHCQYNHDKTRQLPMGPDTAHAWVGLNWNVCNVHWDLASHSLQPAFLLTPMLQEFLRQILLGPLKECRVSRSNILQCRMSTSKSECRVEIHLIKPSHFGICDLSFRLIVENRRSTFLWLTSWVSGVVLFFECQVSGNFRGQCRMSD